MKKCSYSKYDDDEEMGEKEEEREIKYKRVYARQKKEERKIKDQR